jgi:hypothetical protein
VEPDLNHYYFICIAIHVIVTNLSEGYSESDFRLFYAVYVGAGKSSRMRGIVTWLIALSLESELMCPAIDNPASWEIRAVVCNRK